MGNLKNIDKEILKYNLTMECINELYETISKIEKDIIKKYCPFKKGDNVIFTEWWRGNGKDYYGIVQSVRFKGVDNNAIDNKWVICIEPTTKDFNKPLGSYNSAYKYIGLNKKDIIRKAT